MLADKPSPYATIWLLLFKLLQPRRRVNHFPAVIFMVLNVDLMLVRDQRTVIYYIPTIVTATLLFSGYTFPLISMPVGFEPVASVMPFLYYGEALRRTALLGLDFQHAMPQIRWLGKFVILMWAALLAASVWKNRSQETGLREEEGSLT